MELTNTTVAQNTETETPPRIHPIKSFSFTNGALKRHQPPPSLPLAAAAGISYRECLKNHAAALGGHALDGCGEFMPTPTANPLDPTSLKCAACGCHRNFHRRDPYEPHTHTHLHHLLPPPPPPPPPYRGSSPSTSLSPSPNPSSGPSSPAPQPVSSSPVPYSYYSSAPHMLLALSSGGLSAPLDEHRHHHHHHHPSFDPTVTKTENPNGRKRTRTKFSQEQKEKMHLFAEKLGWKMQRGEEKLVEEFCREIGVCKSVFKVWMHNNKNTVGKREKGNNKDKEENTGNGRVNFDTNGFNINNESDRNEGSIPFHISNHGSSPSS